MVIYGFGGNIVMDIGCNFVVINSGLMRIYNVVGDVGVEVLVDDNVGELCLYNNNLENVYLGCLGSVLVGKVLIFDVGEMEKVGMFIGVGNVGIFFVDVKNFCMEYFQEVDKEIWYVCVEGFEVVVYECGMVQLVDGEVIIEFFNYFELVVNYEMMIVMFILFFVDCKGLVVVEKMVNGFKVKEFFQGMGIYVFDWEVKVVC